MFPTLLIVAATTHGIHVRYEYVPIQNRLVAIDTEGLPGIDSEGYLSVGRLNEEGVFKETKRLPYRNGVLIYSGHPFTLLTVYASKSVVYELQKKTLVPGRLSEKCEFTPDPKGKPIPFAEYQYTPGDPPIWNLPGEFRIAGAKRWENAEWPTPGGTGGFAPGGGRGGGRSTGGGFGGDGSWRDRFAQVQGVGRGGR